LTAYPDIHHIGIGLAAKAPQVPRAAALGDVAHSGAYSEHLSEEFILAVGLPRPQEGVQCCPALRRVDDFASKQRGCAPFQIRLPCQGKKIGEGLAVHQVT